MGRPARRLAQAQRANGHGAGPRTGTSPPIERAQGCPQNGHAGLSSERARSRSQNGHASLPVERARRRRRPARPVDTVNTARHIRRMARARTRDRLTTNEVAEMLGINPRSVASYAARGRMPKASVCPCCGHSPTWSRAELTAWQRSRPGKGGRPPKDRSQDGQKAATKTGTGSSPERARKSAGKTGAGGNA